MLRNQLVIRYNINGDVMAYLNEYQAGYIKIGWKDNKPFVAFIYVEPIYRRKGVASVLYEEAAKGLALVGYKLYAGDFQHDNATALWQSLKDTLGTKVGVENGRMFLSFL